MVDIARCIISDCAKKSVCFPVSTALDQHAVSRETRSKEAKQTAAPQASPSRARSESDRATRVSAYPTGTVRTPSSQRSMSHCSNKIASRDRRVRTMNDIHRVDARCAAMQDAIFASNANELTYSSNSDDAAGRMVG